MAAGVHAPPRRNVSGSKAAIAVAVALVVGIAGMYLVTRGDSANGSTGTEGSNTLILATGPGCDSKEEIAIAALLRRGFKRSDFVVGEDQINWSAPEANEAGAGRFGTPVNSATELAAWYASSAPEAEAAATALMEEADSSREQLNDSNNWIPFQTLVASEWEENTAFSDGQVVDAGTRQSAPGDIGWMFVNPEDCEQVAAGDMQPKDARKGASRHGCKNPQGELPRPKQPPEEEEENGGPGPGPTPTPPKCPIPGMGENGQPPFCGTPNTGPEQQPVSEDHGKGGGTPGYVPGPNGNTPPQVSDPAPGPGGSPGGTTTPGGGTVPGGSEGVTNPDDSPGYQDESEWTGDPGEPV